MGVPGSREAFGKASLDVIGVAALHQRNTWIQGQELLGPTALVSSPFVIIR